MKTLVLIFLCFVFYTCKPSDVNYLDKIPEIQNYSYSDLENWGKIKNDFFIFDEWLNDNGDSTHQFSMINCVVETTYNTFWICDPIKGQVIEVTNNGIFNRLILDHGKGPKESLTPVFAQKTNLNRKTAFNIYDVEQKMIINLDEDGSEIGRIYSQYLPNRGFISKFKYVSKNSFLWTNLRFEEFVLFEWDSLGNTKKGIVPRLIPIGYQPVTHNDVIFDYSISSDILSFSYAGLPLIFIKKLSTQSEQFVINLEPDKTLRDLNTPLDPKPQQEQIQVSILVRSIIIRDNIYIAYQNKILILPLKKGKKIQNITPVDKNNESISFHFMEITDNHLFLVNHFTGKVYKMAL
jgi:hypothetical protein